MAQRPQGPAAGTQPKPAVQPEASGAGLDWGRIAELDASASGGMQAGVGALDGSGGLLGVDSGLLRVVEPDDPRAAAQPELLPDENAGSPAAEQQKAWIGGVMGQLEGESKESSSWLDGLIERAIIDEASAPWGAVDNPGFVEDPEDDGEAADESLDPDERAAAAGDDWQDAGFEARDDDLFDDLGSPGEPGAGQSQGEAAERPAWERVAWGDEDDVELGEQVPDALDGGAGADIDRWSNVAAQDWGAPKRRFTGPVKIDPKLEALRALDPFAAPVQVSLTGELGALDLDDPFESLSGAPAPPRAEAVELAAGSAVSDSAPLDEAFDLGQAAAGTMDADDGWAALGDEPAPDDEAQAEWEAAIAASEADDEPPAVAARPGVTEFEGSLDDAHALIARLTAERQEALATGRADAMYPVSERVLADGPDRRVVVVESDEAAGIEDFEVLEELDLSVSPEGADGGGSRRSSLAALSQEPLELDAQPPGVSPPVRPEARRATPGLEWAAIEVDAGWALPDAAAHALLDQTQADRGAIERYGVPLLGVLAAFAPAARPADFPEGSLVRVEDNAQTAPPLVPVLALPEPFDIDHREHRLLAMLQDEVAHATDRRRLATLLHAYARIASRLPGSASSARAAAGAAHVNDPAFVFNRWLLDDLVDAEGPTEAVVTHLARVGGAASPDAEALHRAAHLVLTRLDDPTRALALWQRVLEVDASHAGALLARACVQHALFDWEGAASSLEALSPLMSGPVLGALVALERLRLGEELGHEESRILEHVHEAHRLAGGTVAVAAVAERYAARSQDPDLLLALLRGRFDAVSAEYQSGALAEDVAKQEIGEIFYKAGWALERLGRRSEAVREYQNALQSLPNDPILLHKAGDLAWRLGRAEEHRAHLERVAALARDAHEAANALYQMGLIAQTVLADEARAALDFERALAAMPTFTPALAALGRQAIRQGRWLDLRQRFEAEIAQLEAALSGELAPDVRMRTVRGLVTRYFRVARLLETQLADAETALAYHKRALSLDTAFLPAFLAVERLYEQSGQWKALVALYLGLVDRSPALGVQPLAYLRRAAEILESRLRDDRNAARAYARVLAAAPEDAGVLERAARVFARIEGRAAQIEVDVQRAKVSMDDHVRAALLSRAANIQSFDGDPVAAAGEALPLFRAALEASPSHAGAIEGIIRAATLLGRTAEVSVVAQALQSMQAPDPSQRLLVCDALLAADHTDTAGSLLDVAYRDAPRADILSLRVLAHERAQAWRALVEALEDEVSSTQDALRRARVLTYLAEIHEFRLDDPATASETYGRALVLDPSSATAREGKQRTDDHALNDDLSVASRSLLSGMGHAQAAAQAGRALEVALQLDRVASGRVDAPTREALGRIVAGAAASDDEVRAAFMERPDRLDRYESWIERLPGAAHAAARVHAYALRAAHESSAGRVDLLGSWLVDAELVGDDAMAERVARMLLAEDPTSLAAAEVIRGVALRAGRAREAFDAGERLAALYNTPHQAAALLRSLATEAHACGFGPERARTLLEQAVTLDPAEPASALELERILRAGGEWLDLLELLSRRLAVTMDASTLRSIALARAEVLGRHLSQPGDAVAWLGGFLMSLGEGGTDPETALQAGSLAAELGETDAAEEWLQHAIRSSADHVSSEAVVALSQHLRDMGRGDAARTLVLASLRRHSRVMRLYDIAAELAADARQWPEVVGLNMKAFELEPEQDTRASRALGIGEILSRVKGDARAAAGWFKIAVELRPQDRGALGRMFAELDRLPPGSVPVEQITDALDRALITVRESIARDPFDVDQLRAYAQVQLRRQSVDAAYLARAVVEYLGAADATERAWLAQRRERLVVDLNGELSAEQRAALLVDPREGAIASEFFAPLALVLTDLFAERPPTGSTRVSARSFPRWQAEFRQMAQALGTMDWELWQMTQSPTRLSGLYLPTAAVVVGTDVLGTAIDAPTAFRLGHLVEGLRGGRLLFDRVGAGRIAAAVQVIVRDVFPGFAGRFEGAVDLAPDFAARLRDRSQRLPRRLRATIEGQAQRPEASVLDFTELAAAIEATRNRCGLLCCGDVAVSLDRLRASLAGELDVRQIRQLEPAKDLVRFMTSTAFLSLRTAFGVAVQR